MFIQIYIHTYIPAIFHLQFVIFCCLHPSGGHIINSCLENFNISTWAQNIRKSKTNTIKYKYCHFSTKFYLFTRKESNLHLLLNSAINHNFLM